MDNLGTYETPGMPGSEADSTNYLAFKGAGQEKDSVLSNILNYIETRI